MKTSFFLMLILLILSAVFNVVLIGLCYRQFIQSRSKRVVSYFCPTPATSPDRAYVLFLGDSRISRWSPLPQFKEAHVLNLGCGGAISADLLVQVMQMEYPDNIQMAVIEIGINDLKTIGLCPSQKDFIRLRCQSNLKQAIDMLRGKNIPVVVLPVLPAGKVDWLRRFVWSDEIDKAISQVNQFLFGLQTEGITVVDCSELIEKNGRLRRHYAQDALHLNSVGYEILNAILLSSTSQAGNERKF